MKQPTLMSQHRRPITQSSRPGYLRSQALSLVIRFRVASDILRELNKSHPLSASVLTVNHLPDYQQPPTSRRTLPLIDDQRPMATYLDYAPTNTGAPNCYTSCFERLGFKITATTFLKREMLLDHLKAHVDNSNYIVLRSTDNEAAFMVMVSEFIVEHGEDYWGRIGREHLAEPDIFKGFLYPRDANLKGSRLATPSRNPMVTISRLPGFLQLLETSSTTKQTLASAT